MIISQTKPVIDSLLILNLLLVSFIFSYPHFLGLMKNHPYVSTVVVNVVPISFDENHYATRIYKSYVTAKPVSDAYVYEYRNSPLVLPSISTLILGLLSRVVGSVQNLFIVADLVFPPIIFLCGFYFIFKFTGHKLLSLFGSWFVLIHPEIMGWLKILVSNQFSWVAFFTSLKNNYIPFFYSRLENPEFTSIPFLIGLWSLFSLLRKPNRIQAIIAATSILLLNYSYPYFGIYMTIFLAGVTGYAVVGKHPSYKLCLISSGVVFLGSLPYLAQLSLFYALPSAHDISLRLGESARTISLPPVTILLLLALALLTLIKKSHRTTTVFFMYSIFITFIGMLLFRVQSGHFLTRVLDPLQAFAEIYLMWIVMHFFPLRFTKSKRMHIFFGFLLVGVIGLGFLQTFFYTQNATPAFTLSSPRLAAYKWIEKNLPPQSVILSFSVTTNFQLPAFAYVYDFLPYGALSFIPTEEIRQRIFLAYKSVGATAADLTGQFSEVPANNSSRHSANTMEKLGGYMYFTDLVKKTDRGTWGFDVGEMDNFIKHYAETATYSLGELKQFYKIDYLFWGPFEKSHFSLPQKGLEKIFENQEVTLYKIL